MAPSFAQILSSSLVPHPTPLSSFPYHPFTVYLSTFPSHSLSIHQSSTFDRSVQAPFSLTFLCSPALPFSTPTLPFAQVLVSCLYSSPLAPSSLFPPYHSDNHYTKLMQYQSLRCPPEILLSTSHEACCFLRTGELCLSSSHWFFSPALNCIRCSFCSCLTWSEVSPFISLLLNPAIEAG